MRDVIPLPGNSGKLPICNGVNVPFLAANIRVDRRRAMCVLVTVTAAVISMALVGDNTKRSADLNMNLAMQLESSVSMRPEFSKYPHVKFTARLDCSFDSASIHWAQ